MVYRKGERTKPQLVREHPHQVTLAVPPDGLGKRTDAIAAALAAIAPAERAEWPLLRGLAHGVVYGFRSAAAAAAFRRFVAERWPELLDPAPSAAPVAAPWGSKRAP